MDGATQPEHSDTLFDQASLATPPQFSTSDTSTDASAAGDASLTALAHNLEFTLTVGQALERFALARRKTPSQRTVQRYCIERRLAAKKIRTTFGAEWLINETSLARLIDAEPIVRGDASDDDVAELATPATTQPNQASTSARDADDDGDASDDEKGFVVAPERELRTLATVLIENARLLAEVQGRDAIIAELKEDKNFLREEGTVRNLVCEAGLTITP